MLLKCISLNLWNGGILFERAVEFLQKERADIVFLQEVYNGKSNLLDRRYRSFSLLKNLLKYQYEHFSPAYYRTVGSKQVQQGNAIYTNFPIISTAEIFYDIPYRQWNIHTVRDAVLCPRNLQHVILKIGKIHLDVFNVHGIWGLHGRDTSKRLKMSKTIIKEIKDKKYLILAGDFNMLPQSRSVKMIRKYLHSVFDNELVTTFNMVRKSSRGNYGTSPVDMMFVSKMINVVAHCCPQVDISDHLPLVSVIKF